MNRRNLIISFQTLALIFLSYTTAQAISLTVTPNPGKVSQVINYTVSTGAGVQNCEILIDFGDGVTQSLGVCGLTIGCVLPATHTYSLTGNYTVVGKTNPAICSLPPPLPLTDTKILQIAANMVFTSPSTLPSGKANAPYSYQLQTGGGTPPVSYTLFSGSLPPGLSLSSTGRISGTPATSGNFAFTVRATDATASTATQTFSLAIIPGIAFIPPFTLPSGKTNVSYASQLQTSGGAPTVVYTLFSGSLPPGLSLSNSGLISGTPMTVGNYTFTARATDSASSATTQSFTVEIKTGLVFAPPFTLTSGMQSLVYSSQLQTSGGISPVVYTLLSGSLPPGLNLSNNGLISGTPTTSGGYVFTVRCRDAGGGAVDQTYSLTIHFPTLSVRATPPSVTIVGSMDATQTVTYQFTSTAGTSLQLASPSGQFIAGGATISTNNQALPVTIQNGSGQATETIVLPLSVIQRTLDNLASTISYQRTFNPGSVTSTVVFNITSEAMAPFDLTRMALYFENKRPEIIVERNYSKLKAFADIHFLGSGLLQGYWEVDQRVIGYVNQQLAYGQTITLETPSNPPLPTFDTGAHTVRFVVTNPAPQFTVPTIYYYVEPQETKSVRIRTFMPGNNTIWDFRPLFFQWDGFRETSLYLIEFYRGNDGVPIFSAFTRGPVYEIPEVLLKKVFDRNSNYAWKVKGFNSQNQLIAESDPWIFRFK